MHSASFCSGEGAEASGSIEMTTKAHFEILRVHIPSNKCNI